MFKDIHIGELIETLWKEREIPIERVCNFIQSDEESIYQMLKQKSIDTQILLRWCKLLQYDFFRIYSQHLILFSPNATTSFSEKSDSKILETKIPVFKKSVYTKEIIDFLLNMIHNKEKTPIEVVSEYKIPKTTLYKWIKKYPPKN